MLEASKKGASVMATPGEDFLVMFPVYVKAETPQEAADVAWRSQALANRPPTVVYVRTDGDVTSVEVSSKVQAQVDQELGK
jgi:hypothetical protein